MPHPHDRVSLYAFPLLLQLSKLLSVSLGHEVFSIESWERAMQLEQLRKQRLAAAQQQAH
jgi:hypothetical protein